MKIEFNDYKFSEDANREGNGDGWGWGSDDGDGYGYGWGNGWGWGCGYGDGEGYGYGNGCSEGYGEGWGYGLGDGEWGLAFQRNDELEYSTFVEFHDLIMEGDLRPEILGNALEHPELLEVVE